jgi:hypothetical protein
MAKQKQYLYRIAWFADDSGEETETLGFVYATNDEDAYAQWDFEVEAGAFANGWNDDAFYTVERMEDEDRLRDILDDFPAFNFLNDKQKDAFIDIISLTK